MNWDDEDENTAVFGKEEESSQDLLHSSPRASAATQPAAHVVAPPPAKSSARTIALVAVLLLAGAIVAALVVLMKPTDGSLIVTVAGPGNTQVDAVEVFVDGDKKCESSACKVAELKSGTHMVRVSAAGYRSTADQAVKVEAGEEAVLNITLAKASEGTGIRVSADGSGLKLYVDGKEIGPLPQELKDMTPGEHVLKIAGNDRYKPFEQKVTIEADKMQAIGPIKPEVLKGLAVIKAGTDADGAEIVLVAGSERRPIRQQLPLKIDIPTDKGYKLVATKKDYKDFEQTISFEDGQAERSFVIDMVKEGEEEPKEEEAKAEEDEKKSAAGKKSSGPVAKGPGKKAATKEEPKKEEPKAAAGGNGTININSIPVSNVILDGRPMGTTPKVGISVSAGAHTVVFVHPEHGRKVRSVNVPAGGSATAVVRFP